MKIKHINGGFNHYTSRRALIENGYIAITFGNEDELHVSFMEGCGTINIAFRWKHFKIHGIAHDETRIVTYRNDSNVSDADDIVYLAIMDELYENQISFPSKAKRETLINVIRNVTARLNMFIDATDVLFDYVVVYEDDNDKSTMKFKVMKKDAFSAILQQCAARASKEFNVRQALDVEKIVNDIVECNSPDMIYTECIFDNNIVEKLDQVWKSREGFKAYIRDKLHSSYYTMDPLMDERYVTDDFLYRFMENPNLVTQLIQGEYAMKIIKGGA
jgi:hypothetical protein